MNSLFLLSTISIFHYLMKLQLFFFFSTIALFSCKSETKTCSLSPGTLTGAYKITAEISKTSTGEVINSFAAWDDCKKDDLYTFSSNGLFNYTEGATQCDPASVEFSKNWSLLGSELSLGNEKGKISDYTCNSFKLIKQDYISGSTITSTYSRQ